MKDIFRESKKYYYLKMAFDFPQRNIKIEYENLTTEQIKQVAQDDSLPFAILALNIQSNLNIGNMIRTAHLCGCRKFVIFGRRHFDRRSAVGVMNYIDVERVQGLLNPQLDFTTNLKDIDYVFDEDIFVEYIQKNHYLPVFIEQDPGNSIEADFKNISQILTESTKLDKIPLFIYGNEHYGIPRNLMATRDGFIKSFTLELPQKGALQSYNVSNTCAIISYLIMLYFSKSG